MEISTMKRKPKYITVNQLHEISGLAAYTIYRKIEGGRIPIIKKGRFIRIPMLWVEKEYGEYHE